MLKQAIYKDNTGWKIATGRKAQVDLLPVTPLGLLPQMDAAPGSFSACVSPPICHQLAVSFSSMLAMEQEILSASFYKHFKKEQVSLLFRDFIPKEKETKTGNLTYVSEILESSHSNFPCSVVPDFVRWYCKKSALTFSSKLPYSSLGIQFYQLCQMVLLKLQPVVSLDSHHCYLLKFLTHSRSCCFLQYYILNPFLLPPFLSHPLLRIFKHF